MVVVPALIHNDNVILESTLINEYLDRTFKELPLMPIDPLQIYKVQYLCKRQEYLNEQCFRYLSYIYSGRANTLSHNLIQNHPLIDRRRFLRTIKNKLSIGEVSEIELYIVGELAYLNAFLGDNNFLCNDTYSLADIAWTATIYRLEQLGKLDLLEKEKMSNLLSWYDRMKAMSNFCAYDF